jgi:hypothetical protein
MYSSYFDCDDRQQYRFLVFAVLVAITLSAGVANAGFIGEVINPSPPPANDGNIADINAVITAYNTVNMTSLPLLIDPPVPLLTKSDDSNFDMDFLSDFMFFSDAGGTTMLNSGAEIHAEEMAWFKYTGAASLLYYTVKGGNEGYNVYQYMPGMLNIAEQPSGGEISHISFWTGITPPGSSVPELGTWSMSLAALVIGAMLSVKRRRSAFA